ncbi:hypothetical protein B0H34DRAFT_711047 [Crassisporium funariophilum]|nr:hypothetical protein B0H34DRAFT_711047 [Crassisporium funariophilum]
MAVLASTVLIAQFLSMYTKAIPVDGNMIYFLGALGALLLAFVATLATSGTAFVGMAVPVATFLAGGAVLGCNSSNDHQRSPRKVKNVNMPERQRLLMRQRLGSFRP